MKTGVVLINWNNAPDTLDCISSLGEGVVRPDHILVWDNGSTDDSCERIQRAHPDAVLVRSPRNVGFAEANNQGASRLIERGVEAVWILNNDTVVEPACLQALVQALEAHRDAGAVTAKILYAGSPDRIWYAGGHVRPGTFDAVHDGINEEDDGRHNSEKEIGFMTGCCMLIRAEVLCRYGLFNSAFFIYCEDLDWSLRMNRAGVTMLYVPSARLLHKISASMKLNDPSQGSCTPMQHHLEGRNQLYVIRTYADGTAQKTWGVLRSVSRRARYAAANLAFGRMDKVRAIVRGVHQGLGRLPAPAAPFQPNHAGANSSL